MTRLCGFAKDVGNDLERLLALWSFPNQVTPDDACSLDR